MMFAHVNYEFVCSVFGMEIRRWRKNGLNGSSANIFSLRVITKHLRLIRSNSELLIIDDRYTLRLFYLLICDSMSPTYA